MKTLKWMVICGWIFVAILEIGIYIGWHNQDLPMIRHDRMVTIPLILFLTIYYVFRLRVKSP